MTPHINDALAAWLREELNKSGVTQAAFARSLSDALNREIDRSMVNKMTLGKRLIGVDELYAIERILKAQAPVPKLDEAVPLVGYVNAGAALTYYDEGQGPFGYVGAPWDVTPTTVAVKVRGDSMHGIADDGYLIYYDDRRDPPTEDMLTKLCVIGLEDGNVVVKKLHRGSEPGTFTLHSTNAPPMENRCVSWAAKVTWIKPQ